MVLCSTPGFVYELQCFQGNFKRVRTQDVTITRHWKSTLKADIFLFISNLGSL